MEEVREGDIELKKTVIIGYNDLSAAGSRALLGIKMETQVHDFSVPHLPGLRQASVFDDPITDRHVTPLQILNTKYDAFSLIVINSVVPGEKSHHVINRILDLCSQSSVRRIIVLSALHLDHGPDQKYKMYENILNTDRPLTDYPALSGQTQIRDTFLSLLVQLTIAEGLPTHILIVPAHKAILGPANITDGSKGCISLLQDTLNYLFRLEFDEVLSYSLIYKDKNLPDGDEAAQIYV